MKLLVCNSKKWFKLNSEISKKNIVKVITKKDELTEKLIDIFKPDYIFFPHWNWIVEPTIYQNNECVVFHTAPLPYGRGGSPIQNLILRGYKSAPVCAIKMTGELDAGPIYLSFDIDLSGNLTSIFSRINIAINKLIKEILSKKIELKPQIGKVQKFRRLNYSDNELFQGLTINEIYDRIRMVDHPDYPNAYIIFGDLKIEFYDGSLNSNSLEVKCKITKLK